MSEAGAPGAEAPLRLCFVSSDYPALNGAGIGGIGGHSYTLAHAVAALGHDVSVIAETRGEARTLIDGKVRVHAVRRRSKRQWKLGTFLPMTWIGWSFAVNRALRKLHAERPLDLVVFPDAYGEAFRFSLSPFIPFVIRFGGPASVVQRWDGRVLNPLRARCEAWLEQTPARRAPLMVCASASFATEVARDWGLDRSRFRIVRNPLNLDRFTPAPEAAHDDSPQVLFVGHIQPLKGVRELVAAVPQVVAQHPSVEFLLVGNDTLTGPGRTSLRATLSDMLARVGALSRVRFLDPVPQADLPPLYRGCAAFVLPSHHDVYPNAALEAMGCGRPVIVSSGTGVAELVAESGCGKVVPPHDVGALAGALAELLALPPAARDAMGARGRAMVERVCATSLIARQAIAAYREAIARFHGSVAHAADITS